MRDVVRTPKYMRRNSCEHYLIRSDLHLHWDLKYRPFNSSVEMYVYEGDFICLFCKETSIHHGFKFNIFSILRLQHCVIFERLCMWCETSIYIISSGLVFECSMMTSSNGNLLRVTGPVCGEFTGHRWIEQFPQRPVTRSFDVFFWSAPE